MVDTLVVQDPDGLEALLAHLRASRRFDFTGYKRTSLGRRIQRRMQDVGAESYGQYLERLEANPDEFTALFDTILVNVTSFFRDAAAWDLLNDEVITRIVSGKQERDPIRVWSAGCASGQETYSLAITLCEALGIDQFQSRVKIYGTDADEGALARARAATYTTDEVAGVAPMLRSQYFESSGERLVFRHDLRRQVIFGRHDLVHDAPISRLDLLVCRNTLMYFNADTQSTILQRFGFALTDRGFLMLGKAETLLTTSTTFVPVDARQRIFAKSPDAPRTRLAPVAAPAAVGSSSSIDLRALAYDRVGPPMLVLDDSGRVVLVTTAAREVFALRSADVGTLIQDLEVSFRPIELRSLIREATSERHTVVRRSVVWPVAHEERTFDVAVAPVIEGGLLVGTSVVFHDVTTAMRLQVEVDRSRRELEAAYEELQSTTEELETTNEELQSANEELETTNEELQSTNDELTAANDTLEVSGGDLDRLNVYLQGILTGLRRSVIVLDRQLDVRLWSSWSLDLWGVRSDEAVGRRLDQLDIGLPTDELTSAFDRCLVEPSLEERFVEATNRRGHMVQCRVTCTSLTIGDRIDGVIVLVELLGDDDGDGDGNGAAGRGAHQESGAQGASR